MKVPELLEMNVLISQKLNSESMRNLVDLFRFPHCQAGRVHLRHVRVQLSLWYVFDVLCCYCHNLSF